MGAKTFKAVTKSLKYFSQHLFEEGIRKEGGNKEKRGERKRRRVERARGRWMKQAAENPAMTTVTREQHAKPWKSFPASSKTFMEF